MLTSPSLTLPLRQQQLYAALANKGDVSFDVLCAALERNPESTCSPHEWLGPYVTRLNRRLAKRGLKVTPGDLKGTFRLTVL